MAADEKRFSALGQEWVARFDFNAICDLEEEYGIPFLSIVAPLMAQMQDGESEMTAARAVSAASAIKLSDMRKIIFFALRENHKDIDEAGAGNIIADLGFTEMMPILVWAILKALPMQKGNVKGGRAKKTAASSPSNS